jgi:hypothetical protein
LQHASDVSMLLLRGSREKKVTGLTVLLLALRTSASAGESEGMAVRTAAALGSVSPPRSSTTRAPVWISDPA